MSNQRELTEYLEMLTGCPAELRRITAARLAGLPAFLGTRGFHEWRWMEQTLILADVPAGEAAPSPREFQTRHQVLVRHFKRPVVFVTASLDAYHRNRLVQMRIAFIVPGLQLFIPPFASLIERFQKMASIEKLSAAAQVTVLHQLLHHPSAGAQLNRWAEWLGYSPMTMTNARNELAAAGLCVRETGAKPRGLRFLQQGLALWEAARPFLQSPVRSACWARFGRQPAELAPAGLTALSKRTMIEDDAVPTLACRDTVWRQILAAGGVQTVEGPDDASARVECWRYAPEQLTRDHIVDPFSLYLSLADATDERIRLAAEKLLEDVTW